MESLILESYSTENLQFMENLQWEWQRLYQEALVELDNDKLPERVAAAETAIMDRMQALSPNRPNVSERHALEDGLATLRILKREVLGLQDPNGEAPSSTGRED